MVWRSFLGALVAEDDVADDAVGDDAGLAAAEGGVDGVGHELLDQVGAFGSQVRGARGHALGRQPGGGRAVGVWLHYRRFGVRRVRVSFRAYRAA